MKLFYAGLVVLLMTQALHAATVTGRVQNATQDSAAVPGLVVHLQKMTAQAQMPAEVTDTTTDNRGMFQFDIPTVENTATYFAATDYHGVRYFSQGAQLSAAPVDLSIIIFDSTHSAAGVEAFMHHIIIDDLGGALQFRETRVLSNPGNKTITEATSEEHIGHVLFQFLLPAGATNFAPLSSRPDEDLIQHAQHVVDRGIFLPGNKTVSWAYEIPMSGRTLDLFVNATHTARTFDLFIGSKNIVIDSPQLTDHGEFDIRGTKYHRYGVTNVNAGTDIPFRVRRTGAPPHEQSPTLGIVLTAALALLALVYSVTRKEAKSTAKPQAAGDLQRRKNELIAQIARLDISADGDPAAPKRRSELMMDLQNIELQLINAAKKSPRKK